MKVRIVKKILSEKEQKNYVPVHVYLLYIVWAYITFTLSSSDILVSPSHPSPPPPPPPPHTNTHRFCYTSVRWDVQLSRQKGGQCYSRQLILSFHPHSSRAAVTTSWPAASQYSHQMDISMYTYVQVPPPPPPPLPLLCILCCNS